LYQIFFQLLYPLGILLVSLVAEASDALHKLGRVDFLVLGRHGGGRDEMR